MESVAPPPAFGRLALWWLVYTAGLGLFFPFFSLYLRENAGLDGTEVGLVLAVMPLMGLVANPLWGQLADRTGARARVLAAVCAGTAAGHLGLRLPDGLASWLLGVALLSLFSVSVIPLGYSVSLALLRARGGAGFGVVRACGTVGFLASVVSFPRWLARLEASDTAIASAVPATVSHPALGLLFPVAAAFSAAAACIALTLPRVAGGDERAVRGEWRQLLREPLFVRLLALSFATYFCMQGPIHFFPVWIRSRGGDLETVSELWIGMVALEIPLLVLSGWLALRIGPRGMLAGALLATGLRWLGSCATDDFRVLAALQVLHGPAVAGLLGAQLYAEQVTPARLGATAQSLLGAVGVGLGGVLSQVTAGALLDRAGPDAPYLASGVGLVALGLALPWILPPAPQR